MLSNAPDQIVVVYHSAVLLVGVFITYKAVFYKDDRNKESKQNINCEAKIKEISTLKHEIIHLKNTLTGLGGCTGNQGIDNNQNIEPAAGNNDQVVEDKIAFFMEEDISLEGRNTA